MSNLLQNMIVLGFCWLLATGGGVYVTYFKQPAERERLEKAEKVARMKQAELTALMSEMSESESVTSEIVTRWNARYKEIPQTLGAEEVIAFLNQHTRVGFDPFDITFKADRKGTKFNTYVYGISGKGYFPHVYRLIWALENSRQLYRVHNLELDHMNLTTTDKESGRPRLDIVVDFTFELEAFYGGVAGLSISDVVESEGDGAPAISPEDNLSAVPDDVLPMKDPPLNPFYPLIMEQIPPNTRNQVDIESATLLAVVDGKGKFAWDNTVVDVSVGDAVYLGQVISVDPEKGTVTARLNKGGLIDQVQARVGMEPGDPSTGRTTNNGIN